MRRTALALLLLAGFAASAATCPTPSPSTWLYYDDADRAVWDAAYVSSVAATTNNQATANSLGYVAVQQRRLLFLAPPQLGTPIATTPWTDDDRAFFAAVAIAALESSAGKTPTNQDYSPIATKASANARQVMDFRKTRFCTW